jgi:hypothetical protein
LNQALSARPSSGTIAFSSIRVNDVGRQEHRQLRWLAALHRGHRLSHGVGVVAGVDRRHLDIGIFLLKPADHIVDNLGDGTADRDRVVHREIDCRGMTRHQEQRGQHAHQH